MAQNHNPQNLIQDFIRTQVAGRGLDERTVKAYQLDLELFYSWLESKETEDRKTEDGKTNKKQLEEKMETYLRYLSREKGYRFSTVSRKQRVFNYYLSYMGKENQDKDGEENRQAETGREDFQDEGLRQPHSNLLTKKEVDAFFQAIRKEYGELDTDFRRRVCLRDLVMMELLFYHRIEISELLRIEVTDYNRKTATLTVRRKREKDRSVYLFSKALQKQMEQWLDEHEYFEHGGDDHNKMFLSKLGKPLSMKMVINIFDKYRIKAGIEKECKPKDLKNSLGRYAEEMVREMG